jgi:hypothetical protein
VQNPNATILVHRGEWKGHVPEKDTDFTEFTWLSFMRLREKSWWFAMARQWLTKQGQLPSTLMIENDIM